MSYGKHNICESRDNGKYRFLLFHIWCQDLLKHVCNDCNDYMQEPGFILMTAAY